MNTRMERGAAEISVKLEDGEITVRHTDNTGEILYQGFANEGAWAKIWTAIKETGEEK